MIKKIIKLGVICYISVILTSCFNTVSKVNNSDSEVDTVNEILKGSYINLNDEYLKIYNNNNSVDEYNNMEAIFLYNEATKGYIELKGNDIYFKKGSEEIKLEDNISALEFSLNGENLMYFKRDNNLKIQILNIDSNKILEVQNKVIISGNLIKWISNDKIVYYGIDIDNNTNGLFLYDINTREESTLYELEKGYIEYIESLNDGVIFIENDFENKAVKRVNENGEIDEITRDIIEIYDVGVSKEEYYIMGKDINNLYSLYKIENNEAKRLIYDFPSGVDMNSGISIGENEEVLFIGSNENFKEEYVYKYIDGRIFKVSNLAGEYRFIEYN